MSDEIKQLEAAMEAAAKRTQQYQKLPMPAILAMRTAYEQWQVQQGEG